MPSSRHRAATLLFRLCDDRIGLSHRFRPDLIVVELEFGTHLVLEIGEKLGRALPRT
jgi:hypothetical protein